MAQFYTRLYAAPRAAYQDIARNEDAPDRWPNLWLQHVTDRELFQLWRLVSDEPVEPEKNQMGERLIQCFDNGPFVSVMPCTFVAAIASIPAEKLHLIGQRWCRSGKLSDWTPDETIGVLAEFRQFAQQSIDSHVDVLKVIHR